MAIDFPRMPAHSSAQTSPLDNDDDGNHAATAKDAGRIACARCRRLKIKCIVDDDANGRCKRCISSKSLCEDAVSTKKTLKRKDSDRVADLESTVEQLRFAITQMKQPEHSSSSANTSPDKRFELPPIQSLDSSSPKTWGHPPLSSSSGISSSSPPDSPQAFDTEGLDELIRSKIISQSEMIALFNSVKSCLASALRIPPSKNYWDLYRERPILLQVLITIASSKDALLFPVLSERTKNRLLYEYFVNSTRRLDLLQGFLLSCEFCLPGDQIGFWILHSYAVLATEVALDLKMYQPRTKPCPIQYDELEYERTLMWLYACHVGMLSSSRRQPQRVQWTDYHEECKRKLEASDNLDRRIALMTDLPRLNLEIQQAERYFTSSEVLRSFSDRVDRTEASFGSIVQDEPRMAIGFASLRLSLHETYLRSTKTNDPTNTQVVISKEICMEVAERVLKLVESLHVDRGYPSYLYVKPLHALLVVCKMTRYTKGVDDSWAQNYATRVDAVLSTQGLRGQGLARLVGGKAGAIVRWWKSSPELGKDENFVDTLQRVVNTVDAQAVTTPSDFDFQINPAMQIDSFLVLRALLFSSLSNILSSVLADETTTKAGAISSDIGSNKVTIPPRSCIDWAGPIHQKGMPGRVALNYNSRKTWSKIAPGIEVDMVVDINNVYNRVPTRQLTFYIHNSTPNTRTLVLSIFNEIGNSLRPPDQIELDGQMPARTLLLVVTSWADATYCVMMLPNDIAKQRGLAMYMLDPPPSQ
ncbi:C6 zinc finger domain protein [Taphrina deformans PYCC 5710]|uniref:C6 zinc finger domain protein n=1 Tax=Taphrina deformans (strain PYCC 5710 / ATCC 11124 / CBS 356.35 / IMI 108563 / JCM 9778 / NBRC 8474) TaxID=1097556 RepID=R4XGN8_TAPDE|nr:C6 zinc finger domain protein [Taphrina deformans PYCC 5710]|eukprot:CCG83637.1 C6 zinc finger domain protein [Taphrina deformans PYCC 5710]